LRTTLTPTTQLPAILANPSTGIVNSKLVKAHGGSDGSNAATTDKAENWLNSSASVGAGSGPYTLQSFSTTSQVVLVPSKNYWGAKKPSFSSVVLRNMIAPTQLINVQRGTHEVAIDLSADQAQTLKNNAHLKVSLQPSTWVFWLFANDNSQISTVTSNKSWQQAVRYGLDYKSILSVAGPGAYQTPGIIPSMFLGALPAKDAVQQNVAKAQQQLSASGDASQRVTLADPSDLTINGVPFTRSRRRCRQTCSRSAWTSSVGCAGQWLTKYRGGTDGVWASLGLTIPIRRTTLTFAPGSSSACAGWPRAPIRRSRSLPQLLVTTDAKKREALYQQYQKGRTRPVRSSR
jgi:peptide/nickel transport system substrate-binding protein